LAWKRLLLGWALNLHWKSLIQNLPKKMSRPHFGIGGRTRRGFGALKLDEHWIGGQKAPIILPSAGQIKVELLKQLHEYVVVDNQWLAGVPHLAHTLHNMAVFPKNPAPPIQAWKNLIERYQYFRQFGARVDKTTGKQKDQGLSLWPEANVLRIRLKRNAKWPENISSPQLVDKFPRAEFGLPILFHLPHDGDKTFTVQGDKLSPTSDKSYERLASRLILKPLACANEQYVGIAFVLHGPSEPPTGLQIKETLPVQKPVKWKLEESEAGSEPLNKILHGQPDVLKAFLEFLQQPGDKS
jgi:CRISPR-associated protein Cmr1